MRAEIIAPQGFRIAPEGHTVLTFKAGEIVEGRLAEEAVAAGMARRVDEIAASLEYKEETAEAQKRPRGRPRKVSE
jgi:hypothetical protein